MEFKFDGNQDFQVRAVESVANLFEGQPFIHSELTFPSDASFAAVSNHLDLDNSDLLTNLQAVQTKNSIAPDDGLKFIEETIDTLDGSISVRFPNFSVEMETGTGKTYVYLRTALELFRRYGLRKFIIVVPSVAIREGVLKTLKITERHLRDLYQNIPYRYYTYDSDNLSRVRRFALSDSIEFMVMTIDSFNKTSNIIRRSTDHFQGETPIHLIQTTRPVLILDEPQNMESENRIKALSALDPLFALRYSATHRNPYNVVYRLTPFDAYREGLVKRIEVASIIKEDDDNQAFLRLDGIITQKNTITARVTIHKLMKDGRVKEQGVIIKPGESLKAKADRAEYTGFDVEEISAVGGFVRFANSYELKVGDAIGTDKDTIFEAQIRYTVEEHFRKQARLKDLGIKVLSLFFIDRVDNYRLEDGIIRKYFIKAFNELKSKYPGWTDNNPEDVQAAYFASRHTKSGEVIYEDSKTGEAEKDRSAYELIMKDKELLLAFPTDDDDEETKRKKQVCFIFSHSALREGWDNPNIFQICTLNQTASEIRKRQEVGSGVRLAVNQSGDRTNDERVNILTVVANESYDRFVEGYQSEIALDYRLEIEARYGKSISQLSDGERKSIEEEYGTGILPPKPANARKRGQVKVRKEFILKPEFKELWERIKHKTKYAVKVNTERLLNEVVPESAIQR